MKKKSKKINILLIILLISMFIVIPNLLISIQRDFEIPIEEKNPEEILNKRPPQDSYVYYEDTIGVAIDVFVSGDYAYVADNSYGLTVINITNPTNPGPTFNEDTTEWARDIYVSGDYAYVANYISGLAVFNVSDPTNPGSPINEDTTGVSWGIYVSGDYAYIADGISGLAVIDISDPTNPGIPVYEDTSGDARDVYVSGNYAYVADSGSGLAIIDISDPTNPGAPVYSDTNGQSWGVYISGNYAYIADAWQGLAIIDISDPTNPGSPVYEPMSDTAFDVCVSGNYAYVAAWDSGLAVINISDPKNPRPPVYEDTSGDASGVYVSGNYAYVADYIYGLAVIEISEPINPEIPIYEDTAQNAIAVDISGDFAYIADYGSGLAVINISDPTNPGTPIYEATTGDAIDIYVNGDYAYIADDYSGLAIINISDPTNPGTPIYEDTSGRAFGVHVSGDYAYVADWDSGLAIIDISDPTNPGTPVYEATAGYARGVFVSGDYAYIASYTSGLAVIDISDPTNPGTPIYEDTTGQAYALCVRGDNAYIADLLSGLVVINIADPTNPGTPVYEATSGNPHGIYVSGDYAYVTDMVSGLAIIDISNPANPTTTIYEDTSGDARDVYIDGDYAYVADMTSGLAVIQVRKRIDMENPIISNAPSDFTVEAGYTGQSISWTATDTNPYNYTIELLGMGIVVGPSVWSSGIAINYDIPNGFSVGSYFYTVTFTDDYGNIITNTVNFTVEDTTNPNIIDDPSDFAIEFGYMGQNLSWTVTDPNPQMYTIELQGSGIVTGPTTWASGVPINYNIPDGFAVGIYLYTVNFTDDYDNSAIDSVTFTVEDTTNPIITSFPSNITVELGYTGQSISWTGTDANPNTYTIELLGTGIVAGPTAWTSGNPIIYNISDGFGVGSYYYDVNFTDISGNVITDIVNFTVVEEITNPVVTLSPNDFTVEYGYTGQILSWSATDLNPNTYTIELVGSGIVTGPSAWTSGININYNIPDGFSVGVYVYIVNFTDDYGNSITDSVIFTVEDATDPIILSSPSDLAVEFGYTGQSLSWTASDPHPDSYTIELQGSGIVAGPTVWISSAAITYNIPDSFAVGDYIYIVNFTDNYGNSIIDNVTFTVGDTTIPTLISAPSDLTVDSGYTGQSVSWTATDPNPHMYTIELQGTGIVTGPTTWTSGVNIVYNIPDGFVVGTYIYIMNFTDDYGNSITDNVTFAVTDTTSPVITVNPTDLNLDLGYTGESLSWTATDINPNTYTIELQGTGVVSGPTTWTSGTVISYNIPDGFAAGVYTYSITFTDGSGNSVSDTVTVTVAASGEPPTDGIPFGNFFLVFIGLGIFCLIASEKRNIVRKSSK